MNALLYQASGPSLPGIFLCVVLEAVAGLFRSPPARTEHGVGPRRGVKRKDGERSSAGAACRSVSPASSHILSHQIKERQVTEDGSRAAVSPFRPPTAIISAHFLSSFFLYPMMPRCVVWRQPQKMRGCRQPETQRMHPSVRNVCACVCVCMYLVKGG